MRRFAPPQVRAVNKNGAMVLDEKGVVQGPFTHGEWLEYSFWLFDWCHDLAQDKTGLDWSKVYFRHKDDFIGGNFNLFYKNQT